MFNKLPPYAYNVSACLSSPDWLATRSGCTREAASIWITSDPYWPDARPNHLSVLMPYGEDPFQYDWTFLAAHEPILFERSLADTGFAVNVAKAMFQCGVTRILCLGYENTELYVREEVYLSPQETQQRIEEAHEAAER